MAVLFIDALFALVTDSDNFIALLGRGRYLQRFGVEAFSSLIGSVYFISCLSKGFRYRTLNLLSHGKYAINEPTEMGDDNKELFRRILTDFTAKFQFELPEILAAAPVAAAPALDPTP